MPYTSHFDGSTVVSKKIACEILNLNISRPGLEFTDAEIKKAYKTRAFRVHPDKQSQYTQAIPENICNELMNDIERARDYMLNSEDNIPRKANWEDMLMDIMKDIKSDSSEVRRGIRRISYFCNDISIIMFLSEFSVNKLNLRLINVFSHRIKDLETLLQTVDVIDFVNKLQKALNQNEEKDIRTSIMGLKDFLPEHFKNKKLDALFDAIYDANKELKKILTDDLIVNIKHIIYFLTNFIANIPSWKHILGVYFVSLLFTSDSLPNYFNATKIIHEVIWQQKGATSFVLSAFPLLILHTILLPLKISILLVIKLTKIALETFGHLLANIIIFLNAFCSLFSKKTSFFRSVLFLFKAILASNFSLVVNIAIKLLDEIIFIISNQNILSSFLSTFNHWINSHLKLNGLSEKKISTLTTTGQEKMNETLEHEKSNQTFGLFDNKNSPLHNEEDKWLAKVLADIPHHNLGVNFHEGFSNSV